MDKSFAKYSDDELARLMKGGSRNESEKAFTEIYRRFSPRIHSYCICMLNDRDQAEDIFQETFIKFYDKFDPYHETLNVPGYLMTIARNLCLNYKRGKKETIPIENMENILTDINSYEKNELFDLIVRSLDLLDDKFRDAFIMREFNGFLYKEIAEISNTSLTNAKSRVARAREKLINILEPYMKELTD